MQTTHDHLPELFKVSFDALKKRLAAEGVNSRGWRLYLDHGDALFTPMSHLLDAHAPLRQRELMVVDWLKLLQACEMSVLPPFALSQSMSHWRLPGGNIAAIPPLFFRALWQAVQMAEYAGDNVATFIRDQVTPLAQWFFGQGVYKQLSDSQLKGGWKYLQEKFQQACHKNGLGSHDWAPFLTKIEFNGYRFVALASKAALEFEGKEMSHCIADYEDKFRNEMMRAWAVYEQKSGRHVATMAVMEPREGSWQIIGIHGPANACVADMVKRAAMAVVFSLEEAYNRVPSVRQAMQRARNKTSCIVFFGDECANHF